MFYKKSVSSNFVVFLFVCLFVSLLKSVLKLLFSFNDSVIFPTLPKVTIVRNFDEIIRNFNFDIRAIDKNFLFQFKNLKFVQHGWNWDGLTVHCHRAILVNHQNAKLWANFENKFTFGAVGIDDIKFSTFDQDKARLVRNVKFDIWKCFDKISRNCTGCCTFIIFTIHAVET